jgi:hypothetical protein
VVKNGLLRPKRWHWDEQKEMKALSLDMMRYEQTCDDKDAGSDDGSNAHAAQLEPAESPLHVCAQSAKAPLMKRILAEKVYTCH